MTPLETEEQIDKLAQFPIHPNVPRERWRAFVAMLVPAADAFGIEITDDLMLALSNSILNYENAGPRSGVANQT